MDTRERERDGERDRERERERDEERGGGREGERWRERESIKRCVCVNSKGSGECSTPVCCLMTARAQHSGQQSRVVFFFF